jgi:hypothetical protein
MHQSKIIVKTALADKNFSAFGYNQTFTHVCAGASADTARCVALPRVNYGAAAAYFLRSSARHYILILTT